MSVTSEQKKLRELFSHISELMISPEKVDVVMEKIMQETEELNF